MNAALDWSLWKPFFFTLAIGTTLIYLAALMMQQWIHSMAWRRTIWQIAFLSLGLLAMVELSGTSRMAWSWAQPQTQASSDGTELVESKVIGEPDVRMLLVDEPQEVALETATLAEPFTSQESVWWPGAIWSAGFGAVLSWMLMVRLFFLGFVPRRALRDEAVLARVNRIARQLGMSERVRVTEARGLAGPIAFGLLRAGISLPEGFARRFSGEQQDVMLAHELAHLAARDPLWHTLADVVMAILWWHPLAWLVKRELRATTEAAADEASLLIENGPAALAECLVELGGRLTRKRPLGWLGMEGGDFRSGLGKRVTRLVSLGAESWKPMRRSRLWLVRTIAPLLVVATALASTVWAQPSTEGTSTLRQALERSVLGIALTAAMPTPQEKTETQPEPTVKETLPTGVQRNQTRIGQEIVIPISAGAAVTSPNVSQQPALHTRWFKIDPAVFRQSLASLRSLSSSNANAAAHILREPARTNSQAPQAIAASDQLLKEVGDFFRTAGVDFSVPGKQLLFNDGSGQLMARATLEDLEIIEQAVQVLNTSPPQVTIEVKFYEVTTEDARSLGFDWLLGGAFTKSLSDRESEKPNSSATAVLTYSQSRIVMRAMEQRGKTNLLSAPKMTMLSGRQGQLKNVGLRYVVTDLDWSASETNAVPGTNGPLRALPIAEPFELGPVLDIIPYVLTDGYTIQMTLIPTFTEFLGYDLDYGNRQETVTMPDGRKEIVTVPDQPCPIFRKRQMVSSAIVWDGQTVVLASGPGQFLANPTRDEPLRQGTKIPTNSGPKNLVIFVTATLVDKAGNRIHAPEEIPPGVPRQQPAKPNP